MKILQKFLQSEFGNFAMITGLLMVPLMGAVGLAVDYARISHARYVLMGAADAAAASAVSKASPTYKNGIAFNADWTQQDAERDALNLFNANVVNNVDFTLEKAEARVTQGGGRITALVDFKVRVPLIFMRIFYGRDDFVVSGTASATVGTVPYIDFYLVLDNSPSMGLGATTADIALLEKNTPNKCAFACHIVTATTDNYRVARNIGATLRIDVVRKAAQNLFDKAKQIQVEANQYRMATYTFGDKASTLGLTEVALISGDFDEGKRLVGEKVNLMSLAKDGEGDDAQSPFDRIFSDLNKKITADGGFGSGPTDRQKIVFFVSDGVADHHKSNCTGKIVNPRNRCNEPIDPKICEALQKRNIKIAVLYTTYLPLPKDGHWYWFVRPYQDQIGVKMRQCASDNLYFEVSPSQGIVEAMEALFKKALLSPPRITS